ncbi:hypothetical protein F5Y18DRAFT_329639 [Xylariaceae sp. FL1019]|nr:hypothetical protein F5Y18DRAFT_329639 [Xylariaceae sp. FL1019]
MAAVQSNSSLLRTRSLRAPPAKPAALTAPNAASHSSHSQRSTSLQLPTCTSSVVLFLTNLRLLDLDLDSDWPDITATTFSAKDAAGGQKKRIHCVEWALYRLFDLWDHAETQNKLRPFYPPIDQFQSINLRAALVRSLEQAKKAGVLGRDALIRKTMLDECKGERLEEVLAAFSSAVLKKLVAERALNGGSEYRPTVSESISLENWGYSGNRTELNGLLLAHKASLRSTLDRKKAARDRYRNFEEILAAKERDIVRRQEHARLDARSQDPDISETAKAEVRRVLRSNWTGNEQWLDGLLLSQAQSRKSGLLSTPFDQVWSSVKDGDITDLEDDTNDLLEQLDQRVLRQKARLQKWDDFQRCTFGDAKSRVSRKAAEQPKKSGVDLGLTAHFHTHSTTQRQSKQAQSESVPPDYAALINSLENTMESPKQPNIPSFSNLLSGVRRRPASVVSGYVPPPPSEPIAEPISDLSEWEDEPDEKVVAPKEAGKSNNHSIGGGIRQSGIPAAVTGSRRLMVRTRSQPTKRQTSPVRHPDSIETNNEPLRPQTQASPTSTQNLRSSTDSIVPSSISSYEEAASPPSRTSDDDVTLTCQHPLSPTQALADEILASMNNTSPSPSKKSRYTLSLAERTRMSMTRTKPFQPEDATPPVSPVKASHARLDDDPVAEKSAEPGEQYEDLIARTRRSMAGFEAAKQKAQLERRRSQRKSRVMQRKDSYFPKVEEERIGDASIAEDLIEAGEEDYAAVFMSRPRIATSPAPRPGASPWNEE